ncbi:MAG: hypothetical protein TR69_WS6001001150 [candidate division WS6 bacterium OLB20]|uniref:Stf0 sulfotransferase n=1 Tax=candidate division WS6 bacterium OLB20 TaxID=1617426 RepID=A0A136LWZ6_9BACT|nr:MAG: hypothetical protein TR69_WS6001001150 [candidate division WS6 bacterium OLB20]
MLPGSAHPRLWTLSWMIFFLEYNALKDLMYRKSIAIYERMLMRPDVKILLLTRRNLLMSAISGQIAEQTGIWQTWDKKDDDGQNKLEALSIPRLERTVKYLSEMVDHYSAFLQKYRPDDHLHLVYEYFYTEDRELNYKNVTDVCSFLSVSLPPSEFIDRYMQPENARLGSSDLLKQIPNYQDIMDYFSKHTHE